VKKDEIKVGEEYAVATSWTRQSDRTAGGSELLRARVVSGPTSPTPARYGRAPIYTVKVEYVGLSDGRLHPNPTVKARDVICPWPEHAERRAEVEARQAERQAYLDGQRAEAREWTEARNETLLRLGLAPLPYGERIPRAVEVSRETFERLMVLAAIAEAHMAEVTA
jgi:hypothetical protein